MTDILAAPLQGFTERFFRRAHAKTIKGIHEYYTPFARLEHHDFRQRDLRDLQTDRDLDAVTVPQILVKTPQETRKLAHLIQERGFDRLDINAGCPFPKVTQAGYGAALLETPDRLADILDEASQFADLKLSLKLRLPMPPTEESLRHLAEIINPWPLKWVVMHPRPMTHPLDGTPDLQAFKQFQKVLNHPLVYNGDITSPQDPLPTDTVMLGRGLLQNPLLPLELDSPSPLPTQQRRQLLQAFLQALLDELQDEGAQPLPKLKTLWEYLLPEQPHRLRKKIIKSTTLTEYESAVKLLLDNLE